MRRTLRFLLCQCLVAGLALPLAAAAQETRGNISGTVREITRAMDEIVWTINPRNDTLDHLANYVFQYATEYFQNTGVRCRLDVPAELPDDSISTEDRHNLFMAVKEAFNNVLKHSSATEVRVGLTVADDLLTITIATLVRREPTSSCRSDAIWMRSCSISRKRSTRTR